MGDKDTDSVDYNSLDESTGPPPSSSLDPSLGPSLGPSLAPHRTTGSSHHPNISSLASLGSHDSFGGGGGGGSPLVPVGKDGVVEHSPQGR